MADWWTVPYPKAKKAAFGGPLPRSLYPPSAGKGSFSGPDVIAYKRAVSRAGRWPWQEFDDAYSNAFSRGNGGNVGDTGVAGFQRQMGIDDTGNMGSPTFDALNWSLVPQGLPNAGQPLFDQTAVNLLKEAAENAKPTPPNLDSFYDWLTILERDQASITYSQARPIQPLVDHENPPVYPTGIDCSGSLIYASWLAGLSSPVPEGYSGYGNTGTMRSLGRRIDPSQVEEQAATQRVFAFYTRPDHVVCVLGDGTVWSHGQESGPDYQPSIWYRSGFTECRTYPNGGGV